MRIGSGMIPFEYSILDFTPDNRLTTVHFDGYVGAECVVSLTLPFIGWAVVVDVVKEGPDGTIEYGTRLQAVGLTEKGDPVIAHMIEQNYSLEEGKVVQTRLIPASNAGITEFKPWPEGIWPTRSAPADGAADRE